MILQFEMSLFAWDSKRKTKRDVMIILPSLKNKILTSHKRKSQLIVFSFRFSPLYFAKIFDAFTD